MIRLVFLTLLLASLRLGADELVATLPVLAITDWCEVRGPRQFEPDRPLVYRVRTTDASLKGNYVCLAIHGQDATGGFKGAVHWGGFGRRIDDTDEVHEWRLQAKPGDDVAVIYPMIFVSKRNHWDGGPLRQLQVGHLATTAEHRALAERKREAATNTIAEQRAERIALREERHRREQPAAWRERRVTLNAPLVTLVMAREPLPDDATRIIADLTIPDGLPADLGSGCAVQDDQGRWFQQLHPQQLAPGRHQLVFPIDGRVAMVNEPGGVVWNDHQRRRVSLYGLFLWSAQPSTGEIIMHELRATAETQPEPQREAPALLASRGDHPTGNGWQARTGERWEWHCWPRPAPEQAYDPERFRLRAEVTRPDGSSFSVDGFYRQPMRLVDRGDVEEALVTKPGEMVLRLRPDRPGRWRIVIEAAWPGGSQRSELPPLQVGGEPWNGYVRVDEADPRFFSRAGELYWPTTINLRSVTDSRSADSDLATRITPNRGSLSYEAYLQRLARGGCQLVEIWLSDWNLGLEGMTTTAGFHGIGNYHESNAARLDRVLDIAHELGMKVLLVINHHGQASEHIDAEWQLNPYNQANGGMLDGPRAVFADKAARPFQDRLRRYLVARYGDHPAIFAWKLWTEIDLTTIAYRSRFRPRYVPPALLEWHRQAAARWRELDPYDHPVLTHWSTNYQLVDHQIAELDDIAALAIDAYHDITRRRYDLHDLLTESTLDERAGLHRFGKPVMVTEFGGKPGGAPPGQMMAEHLQAPWVAMVSGHGTAPLLWWYEWVDQEERYQPFAAIRAYLDGEDLRGSDRRSVALPVRGGGRLWCRGWTTSGRILGYLLEERWGTHRQYGHRGNWQPMPIPEVHDARLIISNKAEAGAMALEWWNATTGTMLHRQEWRHPGGTLEIPVPPFRRHLAFKLERLATE